MGPEPELLNHQLRLQLNFKSSSNSSYILKTAPDPASAPPEMTGSAALATTAHTDVLLQV